ncbi:5'/3'-nucleotidase SurE [Iocasia frigidifontis]|uniref:5'-nucleotidase SurE n=1 Tax=Iocasia fonsfrigidae TaxID=2682810 RepID=A0A8A7KHK5_9FIRM|nr:5'/3'-nucleotidase SurE [Iocasia fonsfrigidae]QTL98357.1 5'/3'-nucleotidase SurE [Iocasia fonsfrigidae]
MNILLTNDDGVYAEGIRALARALIRSGHNVIITAPDRERSAAGHSITISNPLRVKEVELEIEGLKAYKINGTPADCVKLGVEKLIDFRPDFIISGINDGSNLGYDVLYSGTVSAAMEAWMIGYKAIAVSLASSSTRNFAYPARFIEELVSEKLYKTNQAVLLNINFPALKENEIKGVKVAKLGKSQYEDKFEERIDPMGNSYFWLTGGSINCKKEEDTDIYLLNSNYITITPLKPILTDYNTIELLDNNIF